MLQCTNLHEVVVDREDSDVGTWRNDEHLSYAKGALLQRCSLYVSVQNSEHLKRASTIAQTAIEPHLASIHSWYLSVPPVHSHWNERNRIIHSVVVEDEEDLMFAQDERIGVEERNIRGSEWLDQSETNIIKRQNSQSFLHFIDIGEFVVITVVSSILPFQLLLEPR